MKKKEILQTIEAETTKNPTTHVHKYVALTAIVLFLGMDFLPPFGSIDILGTQYLYMSILNVILCIYWFYKPEMLPKNLINYLKKPLYLKCYLIFVIMGLLSVINTNNITLWIANFAQITIALLTTINLVLLFYKKQHLFFQVAFFVTVAAFVKSFSELYQFFNILKYQPIATAISQMKGNTGNINIFSATLNVKMAFSIICILYYKDWKKWFAALGIFLSVMVIYFLDSRATFVAILIEILAVIIFVILQNSKIKAKISTALSVILPIALGFFFSTQIIKAHTPKIISPQVVTAIKSVGASDKTDYSTYSRLKYWKNGLKIASKNPVFGVGLGNYRIESLPYERLDFDNLLVSQHTHNDFLEISAETGFIGGIAYFLVFALLFFYNLKKIKISDNDETKLIAFSMILLVFGYGIDSFFNFPLHRPSVQLFFCLLLVFSILNNQFDDIETEFKASKNLSIVAILLSLAAVFCAKETFDAFRLENDITADSMVKSNNLNSDIVKQRMPMFPNVFSNSEPFDEQLGIYLVNEKKYAEAQKYLNRGNLVNPYNGRVEWYKHRIAKETNKKDSAYIYVKKAFEVRPRNYDYFISMLFMANEFKDTTEILKTHKIYNGFVKIPKNWIDTSNALHLSNYNKKSILTFVETGLKDFPKDSLLIERKKVFEYELNASRPGATFQTSNKKPVTATEKYLDFLQRAINFGVQNKFDKSLECYQEVNKIDPNNLTVVQNIGICYFKLNQFKKAILELEKVKSAPALQDGKTDYILGICYLNTQNKTQGCKYLNIADSKNFNGAKQLLKQYCK